MKALLVILIFLCGCSCPLTNLEGVIDKKYKEAHYKTVSSLKEYYFTNEANEYLRDIPCVTGPTINGSFVIGANYWGTLAGITTFFGWSPKNVIAEQALEDSGPRTILHEYIHHLDACGRNGGFVFIDIEEFRRAYMRLCESDEWLYIVKYAESRSNKWYTKLFGLGDLSEQIAYVGATMADTYKGPDFMWKVFRKILRKYE